MKFMEKLLRGSLFGLVFLTAGAVILAQPFEVLAILAAAIVVLALCLGGLTWFRLHPFQWRVFFGLDVLHTPPVLPPLPRRKLLLEIGFLLLAALLVTHDLWRSSDEFRTPGYELEWLTGYGTLAHDTLRETGKLPLWNPYYQRGEPAFGSAFSFLSNPLSLLPFLLFGSPQDIKISITFYAFFAAWGGWFLGRVLGFAALGRIFLALLILGKGNMHAMLLAGYYQLGVQQAYFPWIIAAALQALRTRERWAVAMTGIMVALMFMAGNVWYILPMLLSLVVLALGYTTYQVEAPPEQGVSPTRPYNYPAPFRKGSGDEVVTGRIAMRPYDAFFRFINLAGWRRMVAAAVLMLAISAVYTLPVLLHYDHIGRHDDEIGTGQVVLELGKGIGLYFNEHVRDASWNLLIFSPRSQLIEHGAAHLYYSFTAPLWLMLLLFMALPPFFRCFHHAAQPDHRRIWFTALPLIILMTMWGLGGTQWFMWLYANVPLLRGWRFVGRALAVGAFWIAVLVGMRVDGLWRAVLQTPRKNRRVIFSAGLVMICAVGAFQVNRQWFMLPQVERQETLVETCLRRLRQIYPDRDFNVWLYGYNRAAPFIQNQIRMGDIEAEFLPLPDANTIGHEYLALWYEMPPYALTPSLEPALTDDDILAFLAQQGFTPWAGSPIVQGKTCLYVRAGHEIPPAFTLPPEGMNTMDWSMIQPLARRVTAYQSLTDAVAVAVEGTDQEQLLLVQQTAYPGWQVTVNGRNATLEIGGGLIGVRLPAAPGEIYRVIFTFRPPEIVLGGILTVVSAGLCIAYLLKKQ